MTHLIYSESQLRAKSLSDIKTIYAQLGCTIEVADKRRKDAWVQAIINHQSSQIQAVAQAELNTYIEQQSQEVAPEITTREITFYDHEVLAGEDVIAEIHHDADDFVTQRWVVTVSGQEVHRADTWQKCYGYICTNAKRGTLPKHEVEQPQSDNAVLAQISAECEKFGFELWDEGIFQGDTKLGEVGCTNGSWWVVRASSQHQLKVPCNSAFDAVWALWMNASNTTQTTSEEFPQMSHENTLITELLDKPFDEVTPCEWGILQAYEPQTELVVA